MKSQITLCLVILTLIACKRTPSADEQNAAPHPQTTTVPEPDSSTITSADSLSTPPQAPEKSEDEVAPEPVKVKICDPNFTKLSSPKKNMYIIYVTNFNQEEFKCWVTLEEYGVKTCAGNPGVVFFIDNANVRTNSTPPNYIDDTTLKTTGIGRFEYNGKYWELKGAKIWKRSSKGYGYYNTDNQLGG